MTEISASAPIWDGERAPLIKAMVAAQMACEAVLKGSSNPAFKSRYADLAAVVEAVVPSLNRAGVAVIQSPFNDGDLVTVTTILAHESGATLTNSLSMRPTKSDPQGVGSAITYARRYALLALTGAAPEDDEGNGASRVANDARPTQSSLTVTSEQAEEVQELMESVGADRAKFLTYFKAASIATIPASRFEEAVKALHAKRAA